MANFLLRYSEPLRDGGSPITKYQYAYRRRGYPDFSQPIDSPNGTALSIYVLNLPDADHEFRVRAVNTVGPGEWSNIALGIYGAEAVTDDTLTRRPRFTLARSGEATVNGAFLLSVTSDETVFGLTEDDITLEDATISEFSGDNTAWTAKVTPTGERVTVQIPENVAQEAGGNQNQASNKINAFYVAPSQAPPADTTLPTLTISADTPVITGPTTITITADEPILRMSAAKIHVTHPANLFLAAGVLSNFQARTPQVYTAVLTPVLDQDGVIQIKINANAVVDEAGNGNNEAVYRLTYRHPQPATETTETPTTPSQVGELEVAKGRLWVPRITVSPNNSPSLTGLKWNVRNGKYIEIDNYVIASIEGAVYAGNVGASLNTFGAYFTPPEPIGYFDPNDQARTTTYQEGIGSKLTVIKAGFTANAPAPGGSALVRVTPAIGDTDASAAAGANNARNVSNYSLLVEVLANAAQFTGKDGLLGAHFEFVVMYKSGLTAYGEAPTIIGGTLLTP